MKTRWYRRIYRALLLMLVMTFVSQPVLVAASPSQVPLSDIERQLLDAGDVYVTSIGQAFITSLQVVPAAEAIFEAPIESVSVQSLQQTRARLLDLAFESATALGASGALARSIEILGPNRPDSTDPSETVGIPDSMRADLQDHVGYSAGQIDALETGLEGLLTDQQAVDSSGLPADLVTQLQQSGFSDSEIQSLEMAVGERGLAPSDFESQLEQFNAARDELADGRAAALVGYTQMVLRESFARQARGERPRAVTDDELEALALDQLRLLIHAGQLQALWGEDPSLEVGEGHWWFIERYAHRAAERAEAIILETQNPALLVDLYLSLHMSTLATTARAGSAEYVKPELDGLADLLAELSNGHDFLAQSRNTTRGVTKVAIQLSARPPLRTMLTWPVEPEQLEKTSVRLSTRLSAPAIAFGAFEELNEDNNSLGIPIASSLRAFGKLHPSLINEIIASIRDFIPQNVLDFIWGVLSGQTDNWLQMILNLGLSFVPVLGAIPDIISLIVDPSTFVKAVSVLGIVFSLGDILALLGVTIPIAIGSFVGDAASAALKFVFKNADEAVQFALNGLKFDEAFDVAKRLGRFISEEIISRFGGFGDEAFEARRFFDEIIQGASGLWADFSAFARRVGTDGLRSGITKGSLLAGKVDRLVIDLADEAFEAIIRIGDDLAEAGLKLSDEAAQGLGTISKKLSGESTERFVSALRRNPKIADDLINDTLEAIGRVGGNANWTDEALEGVENIVAKAPSGGPGKVENILRAIDDPEIANRTLIVLREINTSWSDEAMEGVAKLLQVTPEQDINRVMRVLDGTSRSTLGESIFRRIKLASDVEIDGWAHFASEMTSTRQHVRGAYHALDFMEDIGFSNITRLEESVVDIIGDVRVERVYDILVGGQRYELKNVASFTSASADQLRRDLLLLDQLQLSNYTWVFRGPRNPEVVNDFISAIKRYAPEIYENGIFTESNLRFFRDTFPFD